MPSSALYVDLVASVLSQNASNTAITAVKLKLDCMQTDQPESQLSDMYDGYEASLYGRHSDATSDTTQPEVGNGPSKPNVRGLTLSPSIRSSAASTDEMLSPTLAHHLTSGFTNRFHSHTAGHQPDLPTDVQSSFSGSAVTDAAGGHLSDLRSSYSGSATAEQPTEGGVGLGAQWGVLGTQPQAGFGHFGQSLSGSVFGGEPHQRTMSPELGMSAFLHTC